MAVMRIAILSNYDVPVAFLDNDFPNALHYYSDTLHTYLTGTASTYTFSCSSEHADSQHLKVGNKLAFKHKDRYYYMNIVSVEQTETTLKVDAYAGSLELINETCGAYSGTSMSFASYLAAFDKESILTLGINEVSDKNISNEWTGEETLLARLFSLATVFDAEVELVPDLNHNYSLAGMVLNVYKEHSDTCQGVGNDRTDEVLRYGRNITGITKKSDITDLYTAIYPLGKDDLNIKSIAGRQVLDDGGLVLYEVGSDGVIYAPQSRDLFPSNLVDATNRYITHNYSYDTSSVEMLYGQALSELKSYCVPQVEYTVNGYVDAGIGDTFTICDEEFDPPLYLSARVTEQELSITQPENDKTTFDNFTELSSQISSDIIKRMNELISENASYVVTVVSTSGTTFETGSISTTLEARVWKNGTELTEDDLTSAGLTVKWSGSDGSEATGKTLIVSNTLKTISYKCTVEG